MIEINVNIKAPELVEAIRGLTTILLEGKGEPAVTTKATKSKKEETKKDEPKPVDTKPAEASATETKEEINPEPQTENPPTEEKVITLEDVRGKLAALSQAGKQTQVKELITKYGAAKLSDIPADKYLALLKDAEGL